MVCSMFGCMQGLSSPHLLGVEVEGLGHLIYAIPEIASFFLSGLRKSPGKIATKEISGNPWPQI